ncbi:MAG: hypothetical protein JKY96_06045 [Phycisphaerales bacterium]|nr:hypothetical protein [Phycisphaerales bacterium]
MRTMVYAACIASALNGQVFAEVYEIVFSGQLTSVNDFRDKETDVLFNTVWALDLYTPTVGDNWSYSILLDTDVAPHEVNGPGEAPFALYGSFASSFSLAGRTVSGFNSSLHFIHHPGVETAYFWSDFFLDDTPIIPELRFTDPSLFGEMINGGELFTSAAQFDQLQFAGMQIADASGLFSFNASAGSGVQVTVTQVPIPSTLGILGLGCLLSVRRRNK